MNASEEKKFSLIEYLERFYENRLLIALGFTALLLLLAIIQLKTPSETKREEQVLAIESLYKGWDKDPLNIEHETKLSKALKEFPELSLKYGPAIAQKYLVLHQPKKACLYSKEPTSKLKETLPLYGEFSEISLLISEGLYIEALKASKELQINLNFQECPILYSVNLMQISHLEKITGTDIGEKQALSKIETLLDKNKQWVLDQIFTQGEAAFLDYLEYRKKKLR